MVTGSSRGIGEAIALEFAKSGSNVVINSRSNRELTATRDQILRNVNGSTKVVSFPGDISREDVCVNLMNKAEDELGDIDVLVNNAGINGPEKSTADISIREWGGMKF